MSRDAERFAVQLVRALARDREALIALIALIAAEIEKRDRAKRDRADAVRRPGASRQHRSKERVLQ
jgi:hypothetical protein